MENNSLIKIIETSGETVNKNSLREFIQNLVLLALSKTDFFEHASFYGGTALRIFYDLNRFSEDLDFTLLKKEDDFNLESYFYSIEEFLKTYGIIGTIEKKIKRNFTPIESAFAKVNTYQTYINLKIDANAFNGLHRDEVLKVKIELDTQPALGFNTEVQWLDSPEYAPVNVLDAESLFAGKIHAILCRTYKNNVKGRDYYDYLFYIKNKTKPNMEYLRNKLIDTGFIAEDADFNIQILKEFLIEKFKIVNFDDVKVDCKKFILNNEDVSMYCSELFIKMTEKL